MISPKEFDNHISYLKYIFKQRVNKNPSYSLRAFARDLQISPARLSQILNQTGNLGPIISKKICKHLDLNEDDTKYFYNIASNKQTKFLEEDRKTYIEAESKWKSAIQVDLKDFATINKWYYLAIWNYLLLNKNNSLEGIQNAFPQVESSLIQECLSLLLKYFYITKENDLYIPTKEKMAVFSKASSKEIRDFHRQMITMATEAIEEQNINERFLYNMMIPMSQEKYPQFIKKLSDYLKIISQELDLNPANDPDLKNIYAVNFQIFKLSKDNNA